MVDNEPAFNLLAAINPAVPAALYCPKRLIPHSLLGIGYSVVDPLPFRKVKGSYT